jgi:hypothetical protein
LVLSQNTTMKLKKHSEEIYKVIKKKTNRSKR